MSDFRYEQWNEHEQWSQRDHRPRYPSGEDWYSEQVDDEPEFLAEPEFLEPRPKRRVVAVVGAVVVLLIVGAGAYVGTVLLGGGSTKGRFTSGTAADSSSDRTNPTAESAASPSTAAAQDPSGAAANPVPPTPAAQPSPTKSSPRPPNSGGGGAGLSAQEAEVVALTNKERAKAGCKPLTVDSRLVADARKHSADMLKRGFFDHREMSERVNREGYKWRLIAENIAGGTDAAGAVSVWMGSPGHRANILNCDLRHIGVGAAGQGSKMLWTQVFATPW